MPCTQQQHLYCLDRAHLLSPSPLFFLSLAFHLSWTSSQRNSSLFFSLSLSYAAIFWAQPHSPNFDLHIPSKMSLSTHYTSAAILNICFYVCFLLLYKPANKANWRSYSFPWVSYSSLVPLWPLVYSILYQDLHMTSFKETGQIPNSFVPQFIVLRSTQCTLRCCAIYTKSSPAFSYIVCSWNLFPSNCQHCHRLFLSSLVPVCEEFDTFQNYVAFTILNVFKSEEE